MADQLFSFAINRARVGAYGDGTGLVSWTTVPLVQDGSLELTISKAEVQDAEGNLVYTWRHSQRGTVTLRMAAIAFDVLNVVTGNALSTVSGVDSIEFGTGQEITPPTLRMDLVAQAIDNADQSTEGYVHIVLYKVQGMFPSIPMAATTPGQLTMTFDVLRATRNELGQAIQAAFGRIKGHLTTIPA